MRVVVFAALLAACASQSAKPQPQPNEMPAFTVTSNDLVLQPGEETTKCFYFHTPNTSGLWIHKWSSDMTPGSHHMIFLSTLAGAQPADGTIDDCTVLSGGNSGAPPALPMYLTQTPHQELDFPMDEFGNPLAQYVTAGSAGFFQMHYLNATDSPLTVHVSVSAYALPDGASHRRTDLFGTYNGDIAIPPGATNFQVTATCPFVQFPDMEFWQLSTHAHKQAATVSVADGPTQVVLTTDWEHPQVETWGAPWFNFSSGTITWSCTYNNTGSNAANWIYSGQSAQTNEMCMATGYYTGNQTGSTSVAGCIMHGGSCTCFP